MVLTLMVKMMVTMMAIMNNDGDDAGNGSGSSIFSGDVSLIVRFSCFLER